MIESTPNHKTNIIDPNGFSIIELVVVIGVISILSGITFPRIRNIIEISNVDEVKSLLNSAAADCLQKSRLGGQGKDLIDDSIISDKRISSIGFQIDKANGSDKCSYFELIPINENDIVRFPIGFSVSDGSLSKFANPTSSNQSSINSCERWAGVSCRQDEGLKKLVEWKNSIAEEKAACEANYTQWLNEGTNPTRFERWNPNAEAGCPTRPPSDGSESYKSDTCTTNGCNRTVYGLDGELAGFTEEDYQRALEDKYGAACTEWVAEKKLTRYKNTPSNQPQELNPECGSQKFWFYDGVDVGSKQKFDELSCEDNLEDEKKTTGQRTVQGCGDQTYYFCENEIKTSERTYKECSCKEDKYNQAQEGVNGAFSTTESGADGCGQFWIHEKEIVSEEIYNNKMQKDPINCKPFAPKACASTGESWACACQ